MIPWLDEERLLFVGVTAVGYEESYTDAPRDPIRIDVAALPNTSWDALETRVINPRREHREVPAPQLEYIEVPETSWSEVALGAFLGLFLGWPIGLVLGRRLRQSG